MREWIAAFARRAGNYVPDAAASAVIMLFALAGTSLALGDSLLTNVDAFYRGLWMLLPFSMQMTLILVLSTVLSLTEAFRRAIRRIADLPQTVTQVIALAVCVNSILSYLYWGLGLAMGPLIAVYFAEAAERKGLRVDFPFLLATVFASGSVWQFGLSSTAALLVATPGHFLEREAGVMALGTTIGSLPALMVTLVFPLSLILLARYLMPRQVQADLGLSGRGRAGAACSGGGSRSRSGRVRLFRLDRTHVPVSLPARHRARGLAVPPFRQQGSRPRTQFDGHRAAVAGAVDAAQFRRVLAGDGQGRRVVLAGHRAVPALRRRRRGAAVHAGRDLVRALFATSRLP